MYNVIKYRKTWWNNDKFQFTRTGAKPHRNRKLIQFDYAQYCIYVTLIWIVSERPDGTSYTNIPILTKIDVRSRSTRFLHLGDVNLIFWSHSSRYITNRRWFDKVCGELFIVYVYMYHLHDFQFTPLSCTHLQNRSFIFVTVYIKVTTCAWAYRGKE